MVVVSCGFHKTHVTIAAREASVRGSLDLCITGAYPTSRLKRIARQLRLADRGPVARLLERDEGIPKNRLCSIFLPEMLEQSAKVLRRLPLIGRLHGPLAAAARRLYGRRAAHNLAREAGARVYHFRAGFGHRSIERAHELGMLTLCDHSIAHPSVLGELVENRGQLAADRAEAGVDNLSDPLERGILADINAADAVVVNSDFVKETFCAVGWPSHRIHVVYLGVDDNFIREASTKPRDVPRGPLGLLFAGRFERRKGAEILIEALRGLNEVDWELSLAGPIAADVRDAHRTFFDDRRVKLCGALRRRDLRKRMTSTPVFVFPSLAEGSARVVFEALGCGCYVITTPNSGTIVEDGVHGALVPAGNSDRLRKAIAGADRDRRRLAQIGNRNAELIAQRFRQTDYGEALAGLYRELAAKGQGR
jgi:glycosyltransferase involved in cell wall biosynthesis